MKKIFLIPLMTLLCTVMAWGADVAKIGDTYYTTLANAVKAASDGDEIKLVSDVSASSTVNFNKNLKLDLNGYNITSSAYGAAIKVAVGNALVINNSSEEEKQSKIMSTRDSYYPITFGGANSTVTINGNVVLTPPTTAGTQIFVGSNEGITINNNTSNDFKILSHKRFTYNKNDNPYSTNVIIGTLANFTTDAQNWVDWFATYKNAKISLASQIKIHQDYFEALEEYLEDQNVNTLLTLTGNQVPALLVSTSALTPKPIVVEIGGVEYKFTVGKDALGQSSEEHPATLTADWISVGNGSLLPSGKDANYYLDLNGHTYYTSNSNNFYWMKNGKLTILNSKGAEQPAYIRPSDDQQLAVILIKPSTITETDLDIQLNIGQNIIVKNADKALANGISFEPYDPSKKDRLDRWACKKAVLNFDGQIDVTSSGCMAMYTNGNIITYTAGNEATFPVINIQEHAVLNAADVAIYGAGYAKWNIVDGAQITGTDAAMEIRAGVLNINGGKFTATATTSSVTPNGNGTTTTGSAISVAQHTTKLPIDVTINGGEFRAIYPIAQYNPQKNEAAYVDQVNITVNGGKFWATNTANVAAYTQDNKLTLNGGYYNLAPHAFVGADKIAKSNTDAASLAEGYLFEVGDFTPANDVVVTDGAWQATTTWEDATVPTEVSDVTVAGDVTVENTAVAYAHNLTLNPSAKLTIKDGATLVLGNNANVDATANLVVEEGGQLLIAPSTTPVQPKGTVKLVADNAGLKRAGLVNTDAKNLYWQLFAIPTVGTPDEFTPSVAGITYLNKWDIMNGWETAAKAEICEPFVGYSLSNQQIYTEPVTYTFTGTLVGNAPQALNFTQRGFNFFGNSYLAPINIKALQTSMYEQGLEFTIYVYDKSGRNQVYRALNEVTASIYGREEIAPMEGFFMYAQEATQADFQYNSAVYSAFLNKQRSSAASAPARNAKSAFDAKAVIAIESATGAYDEVVLVESDKYTNDYDVKADARKMDNNGLNIYADGSFDNLAVMATNDLMGQTLSITTGADAQYTISFSNVEGELALRDNVTGAVVAIENGASYQFAAQPNTTMEGRFEIVGRHNVPTAIENTEVKANVKGIYSLTGMYLGEDFNALPAGIYVVDGVKIVK